MTDIMTLEEVASYLRLSERTVLDWAQKGDLPGGKIGTSWRFKRAEIEEWVNKKITPRIKDYSVAEVSLANTLTADRIRMLHAGTKEAALNQMIDLCTQIPGVNRQELTDAIFKREQLMSTGIGLSIAVPHARLNAVRDVYVSLGVNDRELADYESLDSLPVQIIVMILAGRDQHTQYIQTLARISKILKNEAIRTRILAAQTADALYQILIQKEGA